MRLISLKLFFNFPPLSPPPPVLNLLIFFSSIRVGYIRIKRFLRSLSNRTFRSDSTRALFYTFHRVRFGRTCVHVERCRKFCFSPYVRFASRKIYEILFRAFNEFLETFIYIFQGLQGVNSVLSPRLFPASYIIKRMISEIILNSFRISSAYPPQKRSCFVVKCG